MVWVECLEVAALRLALAAGALREAGDHNTQKHPDQLVPAAKSRDVGGKEPKSWKQTPVPPSDQLRGGKNTPGRAAVMRPSTVSTPASIVSRTVLVTDIPGTPVGTALSAARSVLWTSHVGRLLPR